MAKDMQHRVAELNAKWRREGVEHRFQVRMGINTGYCNVGNFGSADRMDYTIIGAEANLAARLQSIAEPGQIVVSYETYALIRETFLARPLPAIQMKGIAHPVVPYVIEGVWEHSGYASPLFSEHIPGLDFYLDPSVLSDEGKARARLLLEAAITSLDAGQAEHGNGKTAEIARPLA
jgi:hypothetical protein